MVSLSVVAVMFARDSANGLAVVGGLILCAVAGASIGIGLSRVSAHGAYASTKAVRAIAADSLVVLARNPDNVSRDFSSYDRRGSASVLADFFAISFGEDGITIWTHGHSPEVWVHVPASEIERLGVVYLERSRTKPAVEVRAWVDGQLCSMFVMVANESIGGSFSVSFKEMAELADDANRILSNGPKL